MFCGKIEGYKPENIILKNNSLEVNFWFRCEDMSGKRRNTTLVFVTKVLSLNRDIYLFFYFE